MKHNILILFSLCILCTGCSTKSSTSPSITVTEPTSLPPTKTPTEEYLSREDRQILTRVSSKTLDKIQRGQSLDTSDVINMQHSGIQPDKMIQVLLFTRSKFTLTTAEIIKLQSEGVSFKVINFMIRT